MQALSARPAALLLFLTIGWFCLPSPARAQATPLGWWLDQTGRAGILIAPCGAAICGRIAWLQTPLDPQGGPKTDIHNPNPALHGRPLCGLPMLGGFVSDGSGGWTGGWVYDPELGKTYKSVMHIGTNGRLAVRGYIGIPLFGRSAVWSRPEALLPECRNAP